MREEIERLSAEAGGDIADAVAILTAAFGGGLTAERLRGMAADPRTFVAIARVSGRVACVGTAALDVDLDARFGGFGDAALAPLRGRRAGALESGATAPEARRRGLGRRTAETLLRWLKDGGCEVVAAGSWASGSADRSRGLLERLGFRAVADISGEAYRLRNLAGRPCPICGAPCRCSGTLFILEIDR
jgi:GNAT superfamily N-acetyltransferase